MGSNSWETLQKEAEELGKFLKETILRAEELQRKTQVAIEENEKNHERKDHEPEL